MVVSNVWGLYPDLEKQSNWINIFRWESTNQMKYIKHIGVCTMSFFVRTGRVHHFNPFSCFHHHDLHSMPSTFVALSREKKKKLQVPTTQPACATTMATGFDFGTESVRVTQGDSWRFVLRFYVFLAVLDVSASPKKTNSNQIKKFSA